MKRLLFITGALLIFLAACRGPLAKPDAPEAKSETATANQPQSGMTHMAEAKAAREEIKIEPSEGVTILSDLFADKKNFSGKTVKVKGKITKVNPSIMGKNWIHIQDGTSFEDQYDLTVTSDFIPEVGSIITIEGIIALDKDFGYGYTYPVLLEEGKLIQ